MTMIYIMLIPLVAYRQCILTHLDEKVASNSLKLCLQKSWCTLKRNMLIQFSTIKQAPKVGHSWISAAWYHLYSEERWAAVTGDHLKTSSIWKSIYKTHHPKIQQNLKENASENFRVWIRWTCEKHRSKAGRETSNEQGHPTNRMMMEKK